MENVVYLKDWVRANPAPAAPAQPASDWDPEALKKRNAENAERIRQERMRENGVTKRRYRLKDAK